MPAVDRSLLVSDLVVRNQSISLAVVPERSRSLTGDLDDYSSTLFQLWRSNRTQVEEFNEKKDTGTDVMSTLDELGFELLLPPYVCFTHRPNTEVAPFSAPRE